MSKNEVKSLKPFLSVVIVVLTLFTVVFLKMETRRMSYHVLKLNRQVKAATDEKLTRSMEFARLTRPERIERYASNSLELRKATKRQIIQLASYMAERNPREW
jgi:cell division protein FtsL